MLSPFHIQATSTRHRDMDSRMARSITVASSIGCLIMALAAFSFLPGEAAPLAVPPASSPDYFPYMASSNASFGSSLYSRRRVLRDCYSGISMLHAVPQLLSPQDRKNFYAHCLDLAREGTRKAPLDSFAWTLQARIHAENGDFAAFNNAYEQAFLRGPHEYWLAAIRVSIAELFLANLDKNARKRHEADILTMGQTLAGQTWLAQNYRTRPEFRDRITPIIEQLPARSQRSFLSKVRRELGTSTQR